jgi:hypothetical protein
MTSFRSYDIIIRGLGKARVGSILGEEADRLTIDALSGLRELLDLHWYLVDSSLTAILHALVQNIADDVTSLLSPFLLLTYTQDYGVRNALLAFLHWLIPKLPLASEMILILPRLFTMNHRRTFTLIFPIFFCSSRPHKPTYSLRFESTRSSF